MAKRERWKDRIKTHVEGVVQRAVDSVRRRMIRTRQAGGCPPLCRDAYLSAYLAAYTVQNRAYRVHSTLSLLSLSSCSCSADRLLAMFINRSRVDFLPFSSPLFVLCFLLPGRTLFSFAHLFGPDVKGVGEPAGGYPWFLRGLATSLFCLELLTGASHWRRKELANRID